MEYIQTTTQVIDQPRRHLSLVPEQVPGTPPIIDFSCVSSTKRTLTAMLTPLIAFYGSDSAAKAGLVKRVREACLAKGFFQIVNHGIPEHLQQAMFEQSKDFFSLPTEQKQKYDKGKR
jgi:hypothetical protein